MSDVRRIVFVCTGNTCRSPMAEVMFNAKAPNGYTAISRGMYADEDAQLSTGARDALAELGYNAYSRHAVRLTDADVEGAYMLLALTNRHAELLRSMYAGASAPIYTLLGYARRGDGSYSRDDDVPDPYLGSAATYRRAALSIEEGVDMLCERLSKGMDI